jgi:hypothetical protein
MLKWSIRDVVALTLIVAISSAWLADRARLARLLQVAKEQRSETAAQNASLNDIVRLMGEEIRRYDKTFTVELDGKQLVPREAP